MSATEVGMTFRARWDVVPDWTEAQAAAVAQFHVRTGNQYSRVRDLSLMGHYAKECGWDDIAKALLPKRVAS
jgi:DUF971 family protein